MKEFDVSALSLKHCHWRADASGTRWTYSEDEAITKAARESCSLVPAAAAARRTARATLARLVALDVVQEVARDRLDNAVYALREPFAPIPRLLCVSTACQSESPPWECFRNGMPWSAADVATLKTNLEVGVTARAIAMALGRTGVAVLAKARKLGWISEQDNGNVYVTLPADLPADPPADSPKPVNMCDDFSDDQLENSMTPTATPTIETRVFIDGIDASTLSDDAILNKIISREQQIAKLQAIEARHLPEVFMARVNELEQQIAALKQFVDTRAGLLVPLPTVDAQA